MKPNQSSPTETAGVALRASGADSVPEPLVHRPKSAARALQQGLTKVYELMNTGELESFRDGGSRFITTRSIHAYIERQLAAATPPAKIPPVRTERPATPALSAPVEAPRRRGRAPKAAGQAAPAAPSLPGDEVTAAP